jgi:23S rRNA (uracil1939-C5)-methyltransferase
MYVKINENIELLIVKIGAMGDGIGFCNDVAVYVPYVNIGDKIIAKIIKINKKQIRAELVNFISKASNIQYKCAYYIKCGGCNLQHLSDNDYSLLKINNLLYSLRRAGSDFLDIKFIAIAEKSRRRANFKVNLSNNKVDIGFYNAKSHDIVDIHDCPVIVSELQVVVNEIRKKMIDNISIFSNVNQINITICENGIDLNIEGDVSNQLINIISKINNKIIRIISGGEILWKKQAPYVAIGNYNIDLPQNYFVQATKDAQNYIAQKINNIIINNSNIVDLYCGLGTYSLPLLEYCKTIKAYEGNEESINILNNLFKNIGNFQAYVRDLYKNPVKYNELNDIDYVIINPPRNGAETQFIELSSSKVKNIIIISCNHLAIERDVKYLIDNGYKIQEVEIIDQFFWSSHMEIFIYLILK